jgi:ketosteroid isomerase-like protein
MSIAFTLSAVLATLVIVPPVSAQVSDEAAIRGLRVGPGVFTEDVFFFSGRLDRPLVGKQPAPADPSERRNFKMEDKIEKLSISKSGDMAYAHGTATISWDGQEPFDAAFLRVYRKDAGKWKVAALFQRPMGVRVGPPAAGQ